MSTQNVADISILCETHGNASINVVYLTMDFNELATNDCMLFIENLKSLICCEHVTFSHLCLSSQFNILEDQKMTCVLRI